MIGFQRLTARGTNAKGDNVIEYLTATEALTTYYVGNEGMAEDTIRWRGKGAQDLGLAGKPVDVEVMKHLAEGYAPDGTTPLCQNAGAQPTLKTKLDKHGNPRLNADGSEMQVYQGGHLVGYDMPCSPPKSVSTLFALAEADERGRILNVHRQAVDRAMEYLETHVETRRGKAGKDVLGVDGLVITQCDHLANRNLDPQLHTHCLIYGVAKGADGEWSTYDSKALTQYRHAADQVYQSHVAQGLRELGYGIRQTADRDLEGNDLGTRTWEVQGIAEATVDHFSSRRLEMLAHQAEHGGSLEQAWAATRQHKDEPSPDELFAVWRQAAQTLGQEVDVLKLKGRGDTRADALTDEQIIARLHQNDSVVKRRDIVVAVGQAEAGASPERLHERVAAIRAQLVEIAPEQIALEDQGRTLSKEHTQSRFAAPGIIDHEREVQSRTRARQQDTSVQVPLDTVAAVIQRFEEREGFHLSDEQHHALRHLTHGSGGHAVMAGVAGAGKTTVAKAYKEIFEANGQALIGVAVSKAAADKLEQESGMPSSSVAKLLYDLDQGDRTLTARDVVVLDESGMVDAKDTLRLLRHVDAAGAKLVLQGDERQLQPVGAGAGMSLVSEQIGRAELTEIRRQKDTADRETVRSFYDVDEQGRLILGRGEVKSRRETTEKGGAIFHRMVKKNQIDDFDDRAQSIEALVQDHTRSVTDDRDKLVLAHTHEDKGALTPRIREALRAKGAITGEDAHVVLRVSNTQRAEVPLAVGDRVVATQNAKAFQLTNGQEFRVLAVEAHRRGHRLHVSPADGEGKSRWIDTRDFDAFDHAYVSTVHKAQGQGKKEVYHLGHNGMLDNQSALVALSRLTSGRYTLYTTADELDGLKERFGTDRLKTNAVQEGVRPARATFPALTERQDQAFVQGFAPTTTPEELAERLRRQRAHGLHR
jgi:conjugative relaxase-like TrwC/TraI family protein